MSMEPTENTTVDELYIRTSHLSTAATTKLHAQHCVYNLYIHGVHSGFSLQRPGENIKHASYCSHSTLSGAVGTRVRELRRFSHDLNSYQKKGAPIHLPQTPSPRGGLTQREPWTLVLTGKMIEPRTRPELCWGSFIRRCWLNRFHGRA